MSICEISDDVIDDIDHLWIIGASYWSISNEYIFDNTGKRDLYITENRVCLVKKW